MDTTDQHKSHLFDANCKICTGQIAAPDDPPAAPKPSVPKPTPATPTEPKTPPREELKPEDWKKSVMKSLYRETHSEPEAPPADKPQNQSKDPRLSKGSAAAPRMDPRKGAKEVLPRGAPQDPASGRGTMDTVAWGKRDMVARGVRDTVARGNRDTTSRESGARSSRDPVPWGTRDAGSGDPGIRSGAREPVVWGKRDTVSRDAGPRSTMETVAWGKKDTVARDSNSKNTMEPVAWGKRDTVPRNLDPRQSKDATGRGPVAMERPSRATVAKETVPMELPTWDEIISKESGRKSSAKKDLKSPEQISTTVR